MDGRRETETVRKNLGGEIFMKFTINMIFVHALRVSASAFVAAGPPGEFGYFCFSIAYINLLTQFLIRPLLACLPFGIIIETRRKKSY